MSLVNNLRVVPREDLLERSLNTVKEQAEIAQRESEQLCILIFGHGDEDLSVFIGGVEGPHKGPPTLTTGNLSRLLPKDLARPLNVTGITAASDKDLSYFWPISKSIDRASGGLAASVILQCLIDAEEAAEEATLHPTYAALSDSIFQTVNDMHYLGQEQQMYFSAQNDEWEMNYQRRLGLPFSSLEFLAREYFAAKPGFDNAGPNIALHNRLRGILRGDYNLSEDQISLTFDYVTSRLGQMHEAEYLRAQMRLDFPSIFDVDIYEWKVANWYTAEDREIKDDRERRTFRYMVKGHVVTHPIGRGVPYTKPMQYLTLALAESGLQWEEIENRVRNACL
ncbi:uncharacterized protein BDW43DRAFT_316659 [Aspergillus alliaceus]|uniref:uncharacterized protein n=1 Tax=Petromyces alliaceus TaxID=209559 RepID=UPI0012A716EA|nr:uncharacterized protein BDW43DRAFT_316659 [Aspergillus alliaceus]KAB8227606.1 hypothetical protein BDW43DRAFT_316659 [Aspergillus alliaceus]